MNNILSFFKTLRRAFLNHTSFLYESQLLFIQYKLLAVYLTNSSKSAIVYLIMWRYYERNHT